MSDGMSTMKTLLGGAVHQNAELKQQLEQARAELGAANRRIKRLEEVMAPFVAEADTWGDLVPGTTHPVCSLAAELHRSVSYAAFTVNDLRELKVAFLEGFPLLAVDASLPTTPVSPIVVSGFLHNPEEPR